MAITLNDVCEFLERFAPLQLAESWDNVGLLVGDRSVQVARVMTCLTITPAGAAEAIEHGCDLIVSHHPLPFRALKRITTATTPGRLLWTLIGRHVAIYSPHTSFDSALGGINQQLAEALDLREIAPLIPHEQIAAPAGSGRRGRLAEPMTVRAVATQLADFLKMPHLQIVGALDRRIQRIAVACGAAGEFLSHAGDAGCDALILGETNLHTYLEAQASQVTLLLPGHYASERFAVERLADTLRDAMPELTVWASTQETDPVTWFSAHA